MSPKLGMQPIRQTQIIEATLHCIADMGLENVTIQAVADRAGVSKGIVNHYFENKRDLLLKSFRALLDSVGQLVSSAYDPSMTALEILDLITDAAFAPASLIRDEHSRALPHLNLSPREGANVIIQFYARCILDGEYRGLLKTQYAGFESAIVNLIEAGIQAEQFRKDVNASQVAHGYMALYDGLILYHALGLEFVAQEEARRICRDYLRDSLCRG